MEDSVRLRYEAALKIYESMLMESSLRAIEVDYDKIADNAVKAADALMKRLSLHNGSEEKEST